MPSTASTPDSQLGDTEWKTGDMGSQAVTALLIFHNGLVSRHADEDDLRSYNRRMGNFKQSIITTTGSVQAFDNLSAASDHCLSQVDFTTADKARHVLRTALDTALEEDNLEQYPGALITAAEEYDDLRKDMARSHRENEVLRTLNTSLRSEVESLQADKARLEGDLARLTSDWDP